MEFGLFTEFPSPPGVSEAAAFDESLAQMKAAEDFGFDAVWLGEIHFQRDRSVLAAPLIIASALAACTRRVKIGIAVQVLPLSHPLRLAEDVATVDHISKGRLEFGVGRSGLPGHYQGFNIPYTRAATASSRPSTYCVKRGPRSAFHTRGSISSFRTSASCPSRFRSRTRPSASHRSEHDGLLPVDQLGAPEIRRRDRADRGSARGAGQSPRRNLLRRDPERVRRVRHTRSGGGSAAAAARADGVFDALDVDEPRRSNPQRARPQSMRLFAERVAPLL